MSTVRLIITLYETRPWKKNGEEGYSEIKNQCEDKEKIILKVDVTDHGSRLIAEMAADHVGVIDVPAVVTNRAPGAGEEDLHPARVRVVPSIQTNWG